MKPQTALHPVHIMDIQMMTEALHRAAALARKTAIDTDTYLVVMENGKIVHIPAEQLRQQVQNTDRIV